MNPLHPNLSRSVSAGAAVKPWLVLGPLYENVSAVVPGLSVYEALSHGGGADLMTEIAAQARDFLTTARPYEGAQAAFRGQSAAWTLARMPEDFLTWGGYYTQNHLGAAMLSTLVVPEKEGLQRWRLSTRIASWVMVVINNQVVFDSGLRPATIMEGQEDAQFEFEAALEEGENRISLALLRIGRMARTGFSLEPLDIGLTVSVPLGTKRDALEGAGRTLSAVERSQIEEQVSGLRLERDILYPEHAVRLHLDQAPSASAPLVVSLSSSSGQRLVAPDGGQVLRELRPSAAGDLEVCRAGELEDGTYRLDCRWLDPSGGLLTAQSYRLQKITPTPSLPGYEHMAERVQRVLAHYADAWDPRPVWAQLARYAMGRYAEIDEGVLRAACEFIAARSDTADFVIQGILRLLYWERKEPHLSPEIRTLMKDTVLGFKYWVDEPGDTVMWMDSENHRFLFHTAEWLAGQLYPLEEFSNSRQRGLFHALKGRTYAAEWMRQRGLYGFDEWHSNSYYPASMIPLFNIYDFAPYEDHKFRLLAGAVLDYMFFNLAADSFDGVLGTTHGRTYMNQLMHPDFEGTAGLTWLAFGRGALRRDGGAMGPVALATSVYRLPPILAEIAADRTAVVESRVRQGIASKGNQEFFTHNRDRFADFRVFRTPDYMISGLQDYRKGEYEPAVHAAQVTLGSRAVIFWSCPYTSNEGGGLRPDYWSGNTSLPRVVQQRNLMSLTFHLDHQAWLSHCFFEPARFDEVRLDGNWAFARVGEGYVGIWSQHGYTVGTAGQYAGRELVCSAVENTWLVEGGRAADWGSFAAFMEALRAARVGSEGDEVFYDSPSQGLFKTGWEAPPSLAGEPLQLHEYPLVDSPWAHSDFGSGCLTIRYHGQTHELYFNN